MRRDAGANVRSHLTDGSDVGKFMTPTLRELNYTAPYMHNGMFESLADVVAFYNDGGGIDRNKDAMLKPQRFPSLDLEGEDLVVLLAEQHLLAVLEPA